MPENGREEIAFDRKDRPLREDVSLLGALVGEMLREQGDAALLDAVEKVRRAAIARREQSLATADLARLTAGLSVHEALAQVRAFSTYFQVVNLAERVHRIRRRRDYLRDHDEPQRRGLHATVQRLRDAGLPLEEVESYLGSLLFEPVLTAHPTEATRRTILEKQQAIARHLVDRLDPSRTPQEEQALLAQIREEITGAWQTVEHPSERLSVRDERENVLFFLTDVLYRVIPPFYESLEDGLVRVYGPEAAQIRVPLMVRFSSWVGGDMDGNPNVGAETIRSSLAAHRGLIVARYQVEVARLARQLSQSVDHVAINEEVIERTAGYETMFPSVAAQTHRRHRDMYYRRLLQLIGARLAATAGGTDGGYDDVAHFFDDLRVIARSLRDNRGQHAGLFAMRRLLRRVECFGFHLAGLDVRQDGLVHRRVVGRGLGEAGWLDLDRDTRARKIRDALGIESVPDFSGDGEAGATLDVFRAIDECRKKYGTVAIGPFIVSMTQGADDVLSVLLLARWAGMAGRDGHVPLDVAPLLETVDDLDSGPAIMADLLADPGYRRHLHRRGGRQMIMIGYSDSNKDGGIAAARWALRRGSQSLVETMHDAGVGLTLFHGRGGTVSRGGGKMHRAVLSATPGAVAGRLRVTEQGEMINAKYGLRGIALRTMEQAAGAVALASWRNGTAVADTETGKRVMETIASVARHEYRTLIYETPGLVEYFRGATPLDVIERMQIGSRPASRRAGKGIENLRAIPWVFAWTQSRQIVPGWYGVGHGLRAAVAEHGRDTVNALFAEWRFLRNLIDDVEMVLAKADMHIASHYAALAGPELAHFYTHIAEAFDETVEIVLELKGHGRLLDDDYVLQRSIRLRNPYVDPMSLIQVDLLRRWREGDRRDERLLVALIASVNGIAQALQNTG